LPLQSGVLSAVAERLGRSRLQVAIAWMLQRSLNILLILETPSPAHLRAKSMPLTGWAAKKENGKKQKARRVSTQRASLNN
jgi:aryl-alcohol dehydrogenase-like predicted oxidoreductase